MKDLEDLFRRIQAGLQELDNLFREAADELARSRGQLFRVDITDKDTGETTVQYMDRDEFMEFYRENYEAHRTEGEANLSTWNYTAKAMAGQVDAVESKYSKMTVTYLGGTP
jgi:hypothetical protein